MPNSAIAPGWSDSRCAKRCVATIEDATGVAPTLYRPPYGVLSTGALAAAGGARLWLTWRRN